MDSAILGFLGSIMGTLVGAGVAIYGQYLAQSLALKRERSARRVESQIKTLELLQSSTHGLRYRAESYLESCRCGPVSGDVDKRVSTLNSRLTIGSRLTSEIEKICYLSERVPDKELHELVAKLRDETYGVHNFPEVPRFEIVNLIGQLQCCIGRICRNLIN